MAPTGIKYVSPPGISGYAEAARRHIAGLDRTGVSVSWAPVAWGDLEADGSVPRPAPTAAERSLAHLVDRPIPVDTVIAHLPPEHYPGLRRRNPNARLVGLTVWETDRLPGHWAALINEIDLLLVPSEWIADVCRGSGVTVPIDVVPHVAIDPVRGRNMSDVPLDDDRFVFYAVEQWTTRKAPGQTIRAYLTAFDADDPVQLVIKTGVVDETSAGSEGGSHEGATSWAVARLLRDFPRPAPIHLISRRLDPDELAGLHHRGDCYVSLCRAEGWGLGLFDAAAYGNPVVTTGWGGHLAWLEANAAYLVDYEMVAVDVPGDRSYTPNQRWAEPRVDHAAARLREVLEHPADARLRAAAQAGHIRTAYGSAAVTRQLLGALA